MLSASSISTLFMDTGGVFRTNGWNHHMRIHTAEKFTLDYDEMNERHHLKFHLRETGKLSGDE